MKKMLKRLNICVISSLFLLSPLANSVGYANTIFGTKSFETSFKVSSGVSYKNEKYTKDSLNQSINILEVNVKDPLTRLNLNITSPLNRLTTTSQQALLNNRLDHQVVGAVNASYYETGTGSGLPANLIALNNQIVHYGVLSPDQNGPNFYRNAFGVTKDGSPLIDSYEPKLSMNVNGKAIPIHSMNTQRTNGEVVIFTPTHRLPTVAQQTSQFATEIVVTNSSKNMNQLSFGDKITGTVSSITRLGEAANSTIPENGFVLSAIGASLGDALASVNIGDQIMIDVSIDSPWQDASYMIGTGPMLVKDGKININMNVASAFAKDLHPRTAVAYSKDRSKVFLVTIDGRQSGFSNGVSLQGFAEYLISLGADRAINLDGGGSTTMLVRKPGYGFPALMNRPSDGNQRGVSTTLQVVDLSAPIKVTEQAVVVETMENASQWVIETARATATASKNSFGEPARLGRPALKLSYDLIGQTGTAAAYLVRNKPILFDDRPLQVGAWVFGDGKGHWLRGIIYDGQGKQHYINFTSESGVTWKGWRYVRADIMQDVPLPLSLERVYVVQTNETMKSKGNIYIDQIEGIYDRNYHVDRFTDVNSKHWAFSSIVQLNDRNIITGGYDGSFLPNNPITREQAALILVRELGISLDNRPDPGFVDVAPTTSNYAVIAAVAAEGLFFGKNGNRFEAKGTLTRAEMAVILQRAYRLTGQSDVKFKDVPVEHWAHIAIQALSANKVASGLPDGSFGINDPTTRAQFSAFLSRLIK